MTKVNYFKISGTKNNAPMIKPIFKYGRSKTEAVEIAKKEGIEVLDLKTQVIETSAPEMLKLFKAEELFALRTECKKHWKDITKKTSALKVKAN
jgi:hypothetical protein